ncbi:hypothetical protein EJ110_NYTH58198 [Nymphaea thermarum]|nr:hypothetical protein EJ110_NYTH58198 [Nymphaea thermarum]
MAELLGSPKNAGLNAGSTSKAENVPIQVTSIRLTKDNYLSWSAALEIGITSRGRLSYITGDKPAPPKSDPQWETYGGSTVVKSRSHGLLAAGRSCSTYRRLNGTVERKE